jgi:hypothetical protein
VQSAGMTTCIRDGVSSAAEAASGMFSGMWGRIGYPGAGGGGGGGGGGGRGGMALANTGGEQELTYALLQEDL